MRTAHIDRYRNYRNSDDDRFLHLCMTHSGIANESPSIWTARAPTERTIGGTVRTLRRRASWADRVGSRAFAERYHAASSLSSDEIAPSKRATILIWNDDFARP